MPKLKAIHILLVFAAALTACSKSKTSTSAPTTAAASVSAISVMTSSTYLEFGASAIITVSGGSGIYNNAVASEGTLVNSGTGTYLFTAPASSTLGYVTITISDSLGASGYTSITLPRSTPTPTTTPLSCTGTYTADIAGNPARLSLVQDQSGRAEGYLYMMNYYYPVSGTCALTSAGGTINFTNLVNSVAYTATATLSGNLLALTGTLNAAGATYAWNAFSQSAPSALINPSVNCGGLYNATIAGATGATLALVQDSSGALGGHLQLQGYLYVITGMCNGTTLTLTNLTTGSQYTGTIWTSGAARLLSGTFTVPDGTRYDWSAVSQ